MRTSKFTMLLVATCLLAACHGPGEGPKANAGRALGHKVIVSLDQFRVDHGRYPTDLNELYPQYLDQKIKEADQGDTEGVAFRYAVHESGAYSLQFRYFGPGVNDCDYEYPSKPEKWNCSGYF
jgi:hypothetical protein